MLDNDSASDQYTLGHYTRLLRRHLVLLTAFVIAGTAIGGLAASALRPSYTSTTRVLVLADPTQQNSVNATNGRTDGTINLDTEVQLAGSTDVADVAKQSLHSKASTSDLLSHLTVTVPANTTILSIAFSAHSAAAAQADSNAFAQAYLSQRKASSQADLDGQVSGVKKELMAQQKNLKTEIDAVSTAAPGSTTKGVDQAQENLTRQAIASLNAQLVTLETEFPNPGRIISAASSGVSGTPIRIVAVIAGFALGLLAGLMAPFARERFGRKVRHSDDLRRLHVPVLAEVKAGPRRGLSRMRPGGARSAAMTAERGAQHAAGAIMATLDKDGGSVFIAGLGRPATIGEAVTTIATELGRLGTSVTVIRPDLAASPGAGHPDTEHESTSQAQFLGWPAELDTDDDGPATEVTSDRGSVLDLRATIDVARQVNTYVLVDGTHTTEGSDAYAMAAVSDAVLVVVEARSSTRSALRLLIDQLTVTGRPLLGGLLWTVRRSSTTAKSSPVPGGNPTLGPSSPERLPAPERAVQVIHPAGSPGRSDTNAGR